METEVWRVLGRNPLQEEAQPLTAGLSPCCEFLKLTTPERHLSDWSTVSCLVLGRVIMFLPSFSGYTWNNREYQWMADISWEEEGHKEDRDILPRSILGLGEINTWTCLKATQQLASLLAWCARASPTLLLLLIIIRHPYISAALRAPAPCWMHTGSSPRRLWCKSKERTCKLHAAKICLSCCHQMDSTQNKERTSLLK